MTESSGAAMSMQARLSLWNQATSTTAASSTSKNSSTIEGPSKQPTPRRTSAFPVMGSTPKAEKSSVSGTVPKRAFGGSAPSSEKKVLPSSNKKEEAAVAKFVTPQVNASSEPAGNGFKGPPQRHSIASSFPFSKFSSNNQGDSHTAPSKKPTVQEEIERRRNCRETYTEPLHGSKDAGPDLGDFLFQFRRSWNDRGTERQKLMETYPESLAINFRRMVPSKMTEKDFWERYFYRCDEQRIRKEFQREQKTSILKNSNHGRTKLRYTSSGDLVQGDSSDPSNSKARVKTFEPSYASKRSSLNPVSAKPRAETNQPKKTEPTYALKRTSLNPVQQKQSTSENSKVTKGTGGKDQPSYVLKRSSLNPVAKRPAADKPIESPMIPDYRSSLKSGSRSSKTSSSSEQLDEPTSAEKEVRSPPVSSESTHMEVEECPSLGLIPEKSLAGYDGVDQLDTTSIEEAPVEPLAFSSSSEIKVVSEELKVQSKTQDQTSIAPQESPVSEVKEIPQSSPDELEASVSENLNVFAKAPENLPTAEASSFPLSSLEALDERNQNEKHEKSPKVEESLNLPLSVMDPSETNGEDDASSPTLYSNASREVRTHEDEKEREHPIVLIELHSVIPSTQKHKQKAFPPLQDLKTASLSFDHSADETLQTQEMTFDWDDCSHGLVADTEQHPLEEESHGERNETVSIFDLVSLSSVVSLKKAPSNFPVIAGLDPLKYDRPFDLTVPPIHLESKEDVDYDGLGKPSDKTDLEVALVAIDSNHEFPIILSQLLYPCEGQTVGGTSPTCELVPLRPVTTCEVDSKQFPALSGIKDFVQGPYDIEEARKIEYTGLNRSETVAQGKGLRCSVIDLIVLKGVTSRKVGPKPFPCIEISNSIPQQDMANGLDLVYLRPVSPREVYSKSFAQIDVTSSENTQEFPVLELVSLRSVRARPVRTKDFSWDLVLAAGCREDKRGNSMEKKSKKEKKSRKGDKKEATQSNGKDDKKQRKANDESRTKSKLKKKDSPVADPKVVNVEKKKDKKRSKKEKKDKEKPKAEKKKDKKAKNRQEKRKDKSGSKSKDKASRSKSKHADSILNGHTIGGTDVTDIPLNDLPPDEASLLTSPADDASGSRLSNEVSSNDIAENENEMSSHLELQGGSHPVDNVSQVSTDQCNLPEPVVQEVEETIPPKAEPSVPEIEVKATADIEEEANVPERSTSDPPEERHPVLEEVVGNGVTEEIKAKPPKKSKNGKSKKDKTLEIVQTGSSGTEKKEVTKVKSKKVKKDKPGTDQDESTETKSKDKSFKSSKESKQSRKRRKDKSAKSKKQNGDTANAADASAPIKAEPAALARQSTSRNPFGKAGKIRSLFSKRTSQEISPMSPSQETSSVAKENPTPSPVEASPSAEKDRKGKKDRKKNEKQKGDSTKDKSASDSTKSKKKSKSKKISPDVKEAAARSKPVKSSSTKKSKNKADKKKEKSKKATPTVEVVPSTTPIQVGDKLEP